MINGLSILALIPARGGSKSLPRKNILPLAGKPLIAWTITAAKASKYIDRLILSSDDEEIMAVARDWECDVPFRRPDEFASDSATSLSVVRHAQSALGQHYDLVVYLQPSSPLRLTEDIDATIELYAQVGAKAAVSMSDVKKSPYIMFRADSSNRVTPLIPVDQNINRRQDMPRILIANGAIYVASWKHFENGGAFIPEDAVAYVMPPERSVDIDDLEDMEKAAIYFAQR